MKGKLLIGSGNGELAIMDAQGALEKRITSCQLQGSIRSLSIRGNGHQIYAGTSENNVYRINIGEFFYFSNLIFYLNISRESVTVKRLT